jgi:hypothetical protein
MTASVTGPPRKALGVGLELGEDHGRDFFGRVLLVAHFDLDAAAGLDDL